MLLQRIHNQVVIRLLFGNLVETEKSNNYKKRNAQ